MSLSVVIPTKNEEKIFEVIDRLEEQKVEQIIVVNAESSSQNYRDQLRSLESIEYIEADAKPSRARNIGAGKAENDKIVFLDADCNPTDNWAGTMGDALEENDLVEGKVTFTGRRCPLSRIVENAEGEEKFLTANLGIRKKVFETVQFDEKLGFFREDTDFCMRAIEEGFSNGFAEAEVMHDAGKRDLSGFISDQKRYYYEPYFVKKHEGNLPDSVSKIGPVLYPLELMIQSMLVIFTVAAALNLVYLAGTAAVAVFLTSYNTVKAVKNRGASLCALDILRSLYIIPIGILAKRISLWKGAWDFKEFIL